jgi:DNA-binding transcriptional regulator YiaG
MDAITIKSARLNAGLTQTQAAEIVSKQLRTWQRYEAGGRKIDSATWELFKIKTGQK